MKTKLTLKLIALFLLPMALAVPGRAAIITWTNVNGGSWSVAANWSPNTVPGAADDVRITSNGTYTVVMNVSPTISSLTLGGISGLQTLTNTGQTLTVSQASLVDTNGILGMNGGTVSGAGTLNVNGLLNWNGGSLGNGGSLTVAANGIMNLQATVSLSGVLTNQGTVNWLGGNVNINTNAPSFTGTIWNQAGALFDVQCDQVMVNGIAFATFHNAGLLRKRVTAGSTFFNVFMDNSGTVQAQTGTIFFSGGANLVGSFQANSGAAINFNGGTYTLSSPPNFQGPGAVQLIAGSSATLNAFTGIFTLNGATLVGQSTIASSGIISLSGSSLGAGATLTVLTNGVLNFPAAVSLSGVLTNQGTINWLGGNVNINTNGPSTTGTIWNQAGALFDIQCDQVVANGIALATFHNAGLLRKRVTAGSTSFNVFMDNSGTVQAQTGTIFFSGGANLGGSFQANSGAAINFNGGTYALSSPPNFQGPGAVQFTGGDITLNAFTGTYTLNGSTLVGQSTIASNGIISLSGSSLGAGATLTVLTNGVLNFPATVSLSGVLTNQGTVNWLGGNVNINTNAPSTTGTIWNQAGALFDIQCDQVVANGIALATFHNAGLVRKRVTAGTTTFNVFMDNSGTVQAQTGVLTINSYLGSAMSSLAITLASNTPATGFGKIQFATTNSIVGKFILSTLGGYRPTPGTSFFVLGFPAVTGDFTSMEGLDLGNGLRLAPRPFASGMRLVAASYPITALPNLTLDHSLKGLLVGWPTNFTGWMLQTTTNLVAPSWQTIPVAGTNNTIVPIAGIQQYFRLFQ